MLFLTHHEMILVVRRSVVKKRIIEELKGWSENAIMCAELEANGLEGNPGVEELRKLVAQARAAGMTNQEIGELIWTPYSGEAEVMS